MDSKFLNFIDPVLKYIDSGSFFRQPFKWLYVLIGVCNIMLPISMIGKYFDYWDYLSGSAKFAMIIIILVALALAYVGFLIWYKRSQTLNLEAYNSSRFIAIPVIANLIQTIGEWFGIIVGVGGFICVLICLIFGGNDLRYILPGEGQFTMLIGFPVLGYIAILFTRFLAENCLALASIANSCKSIDRNIKAISDSSPKD